MLYSKNGSIPKTETDGTDGWVEVPDPPIPPEGMEVVWWCPPGWVVRPIKPVKEGFQYDWSQSEEKWMESAVEVFAFDVVEPFPSQSGTDTISLGAADATTAA